MSVNYKQGFKGGDDGSLYLNGVNINTVPISELLSAWKALSGTNIKAYIKRMVSTSLLEELSTRIAVLETDIKTRSELEHKRNMEIIDLQVKVTDQSNALDIMRHHCQKAVKEKVSQATKITALESDKKYLHSLIKYQKAELHEQAKK